MAAFNLFSLQLTQAFTMAFVFIGFFLASPNVSAVPISFYCFDQSYELNELCLDQDEQAVTSELNSSQELEEVSGLVYISEVYELTKTLHSIHCQSGEVQGTLLEEPCSRNNEGLDIGFLSLQVLVDNMILSEDDLTKIQLCSKD